MVPTKPRQSASTAVLAISVSATGRAYWSLARPTAPNSSEPCAVPAANASARMKARQAPRGDAKAVMRSSLFDTQGEVSLLLPDGRAGYCNFKQVKALREGGMVGVFPGAFLIAG